ncbi:hypothetical protein FPCIR_10429 [Fusarium pseudocircinatum]|uniref:Uncharacterized protein n=1 Tax=Fusarium pseudocircinatum TaxID=56676 RepID=A0A8H5KUZ0_9HYPO|nr:hypothetical protein FPCIR_10429 [Fusarium pseudocircinatum]
MAADQVISRPTNKPYLSPLKSTLLKMARHHHLHEHQHDADQPDTPTLRGRPRHSEDDTPEGDDEPRTEETVVNIVDELPRSGLVIFDDCVSLVHVNNLPERALNRWREEEQRHQQQPQETQPQRSQIPPSIYDGSAPVLSSRNLTQVSRACIIASNGFYVVNCDTSGPQVNICWRVPGPRNIWLARLAASQDGSDTANSPSIVPGMTLSCFRRGSSGGESAWSIIMAKSRGNVEERIERGEGELVFGEPISEEGLVAFGRAVGIEVFRPSPLSSSFLLPSISSHHNTRIRIIGLNTAELARMRTKSRAECRRRKALRRAQGNEQQSIAVPRPIKVESDASTPSGVSDQSVDAQNESHTHRGDAPLGGEATRHASPQRDTSQNDANEEDIPSQRPHLAAFSLLRILPAVEIHTNKPLLIKNPRADGPQTDICARIPGSENNWAARVSCYDSLYDFRDWILRNAVEEHPEIWMYVSTSPHGGFVDFYGPYDFSLVKPLSIVIISNPGRYLPWNWIKPPSGYTSACPLMPGLRGVLGHEGSKWLV